MHADADLLRPIHAVLDRFSATYAARDEAGFLGCFAMDADVVAFGTGADEKRLGIDGIREQVRRDWAQSEAAGMGFTWTSVSTAGDVAWVAADCLLSFRVRGQAGVLPARASVVLRRRDADWRIVHLHVSVPTPTQPPGRSF